MKRLFDADVAKGSVVNGIAFALTVLVYVRLSPVFSGVCTGDFCCVWRWAAIRKNI